MENPELIPDAEQVKHLVNLALAETTGTAEKAMIHIGPFSTFILISCLQLAQRKPDTNDIFSGTIGQLIEQLSVLFPEDGIIRALIEQGNDPRYDVTEDQAASIDTDALAAEVAELAGQLGYLGHAGQLGPHEPPRDAHIYQTPVSTELEASLAVANICGWKPSRLIGFIVLAYDGSDTSYLLTNRSKERVIDGLESSLIALRGREIGQQTPHENDHGKITGSLTYRDSEGETQSFKCPQCEGGEWVVGTLGDASPVLVCGTCSITLTKDQCTEILDKLGTQPDDEH